MAPGPGGAYSDKADECTDDVGDDDGMPANMNSGAEAGCWLPEAYRGAARSACSDAVGDESQKDGARILTDVAEGDGELIAASIDCDP